MNTLTSTFASAIAILGCMSGAANAATVRPAGPTTFNGPVTLTYAGSPLSCTGNMTIDATASGSDGHFSFSPALASDPSHAHGFRVATFTLTGTACSAGILTFIGLPYVVNVGISSGSPPNTIWALTVPTTFATICCPGTANMAMSFSNAGQTLTIPSQMLTASVLISGVLTRSSGSTFRID